MYITKTKEDIFHWLFIGKLISETLKPNIPNKQFTALHEAWFAAGNKN